MSYNNHDQLRKLQDNKLKLRKTIKSLKVRKTNKQYHSSRSFFFFEFRIMFYNMLLDLLVDSLTTAPLSKASSYYNNSFPDNNDTINAINVFVDI